MYEGFVLNLILKFFVLFNALTLHWVMEHKEVVLVPWDKVVYFLTM